MSHEKAVTQSELCSFAINIILENEGCRVGNEKHYNLKPITNNIPAKILQAFLESCGLGTKFSNARKPIDEFFADMLLTEVVTKTSLEQFFFDSLQYGNHRSCYMLNIENFGNPDLNTFLIALGKSKKFINIISHADTTAKEELIALQPNYNTSKKISTVSLLYRQRIETLTKGNLQSQTVFIPVCFDLEKSKLFVRVCPNIEGEKEKKYRYSEIADKYIMKMQNLFKLDFSQINDLTFQKIYNVTQNLTQEYFAHISSGAIDDSLIQQMADSIEQSLQIDNLAEKSSMSGIYDIRSNLRTLLENILVMEFEQINTGRLDELGLNGYISYFRYADRKLFKTRFRGENYRKPVTESETFLVLREDLKRFREIEAIQVYWYQDRAKSLRVKYEVDSIDRLLLRFYDDLTEGDFEYAIRQFDKFGQKDFANVQCVDKTYAAGTA